MLTYKDHQFKEFKKILKFVFTNKYSDFYRRKFQNTEFNPEQDFRSLEDVKKIPLLTKEELIQEPPVQRLFVPEEEVESICSSSGTTVREPCIIFWSNPIIGNACPVHYQRRVLILFPPHSLPLMKFVLDNSAEVKVKYSLCGDISNLPLSCHLALKGGVDHIECATATLVIILKEYLLEYPKLLKNLRSLAMGGELVTPAKRKLLWELYPDKEIFINYGLSEAAGRPGIQCYELAKREEVLFHAKVNDCYFEVINPDTGEVAPFGEEGELILTSFKNPATPIIRYRTGDRASFRENDCPCGRPGPLLKIHGRINYSIVRVGGFELRAEMLEKPLMNLSSFLKDEFEAHLYETFLGNKPRIKIELNLSPKEGVEDSLFLKRKIEQEILENWRLSPRLNLRQAVEAGLFEILRINFVRFPQSAKPVRRLILH